MLRRGSSCATTLFDARNYFNPAPAKVAELRFHTYGFNVGGQVPFWKSHPTFFFYNMEWRSLIQGQMLNQTVPLPSTYGGDFGSTLITVPTAAHVSPAILAQYAADGLTPGQPFPNNTIPANLLDPNAQALLAAGIFPAPTSGKQFIGGNNVPTNVREEIARVDHQFTDKFSIFGHWVSEQISQNLRDIACGAATTCRRHSNTFGNPSYSARNPHHLRHQARRCSTKWPSTTTATASPSFPWSRRPSRRLHHTGALHGPNNLERIPEIKLGGATGADYTTSSWPWNNKADDYQIRDDISWTKGAHQFKIGGSWAIYKKIQDLFGQTQGWLHLQQQIHRG